LAGLITALVVIEVGQVLSSGPTLPPSVQSRLNVSDTTQEEIGQPCLVNEGAGTPSAALLARRPAQVYLGITYLPVTKAVAEFYDLNEIGSALITAVESNGPADRAGLRPNDLIVEFGGTPLTPDTTLVVLTLRRTVGDQVSVTIVRQKQRRQVCVSLTD